MAVVVVERRHTPDWIDHLVASLDLGRRQALERIRYDDAHSNDIYELSFSDGRVLLVKRARHEWVRSCFEASAAAAHMIDDGRGVVVPRPLLLDEAPPGMPVQAYWRVPLPTLAGLWPGLSRRRRAAALRSLGSLARRLHEVGAPGWGPVTRDAGGEDLAAALHRDLRRRLLPAVIAHWPEGIPCLEQLIEWIPLAQHRAGGIAALVHCDLHLGNVLCRVGPDGVECVGFLDLDGVAGGQPESDLACFDVLHGRLFERHLDVALRRELATGYGGGLDGWLLEYFRCVHLANQGFSSALLGHCRHAGRIAATLRRRIRCCNVSVDPGALERLHEQLGQRFGAEQGAA